MILSRAVRGSPASVRRCEELMRLTRELDEQARGLLDLYATSQLVTRRQAAAVNAYNACQLGVKSSSKSIKRANCSRRKACRTFLPSILSAENIST